MDNKYVYGNSTAGQTGGSATHAHTYAYATGITGNNTPQNQSAGAYCPEKTHTHTVSGTTSSVANDPPYITVLIYQKNTDILDRLIGGEESR
jgi:hypothetical protein